MNKSYFNKLILLSKKIGQGEIRTLSSNPISDLDVFGAKDIFNCIINNYPIGVFSLWEFSGKITQLNDVFDCEMIKNFEIDKKYVIDIKSYTILKTIQTIILGGYKDTRYILCYDVEEQTVKVYTKDKLNETHEYLKLIPVNNFFNTFVILDMLDKYKLIEDKQKSKFYIESLKSIVSKVQEYEVPVCEIYGHNEKHILNYIELQNGFVY